MGPATSVFSLLILIQSPGAPPPRDTTAADTLASRASRTVLSRRMLQALPGDDPRASLILVPGAALRGNTVGIGSGSSLSLRLGSPGGASVYIDGAPARFLISGVQGVTLATGAVETVAVTTGLPDPGILDGRGGVIEYATPTGGARLAGRLLAHTDAPFGDGSSVGFNRFEGSAGGPLGTRLSWFAAGELAGQRSAYRGLGAAEQPAFLWGAPDTTADTVTIPTFVQSSELRRPLDWLTSRRALAKLAYRYGQGGSVALTGILSDLQQRFYPGADIGNPSLFSGARQWSRLAVLNLSHSLGAARPLDLHATISLAQDRASAGLLTPASESSSRDPRLGIAWSALEFTGSDSIPLPLTDRIVRNIRSNSGLRVPFLNRVDLRNVQPFRLNPYGLASGWPTQGSDGTLSALSERRTDIRAWVAWSPLATHLARFGIEYERASQTFYRADLLSQVGEDAWIAEPRRWGAFAADRISWHRLSLEVGARVDRFTAGGDLPNVPGRIFTNPSWSPNTGTDDTAYANSLARVFAPVASHTAFSPQVRAEYAVAANTLVWADLGQVAQPPTSAEVFGGSNADLAFSAARDPHGGDAGVLKSTMGELGVRQAIGTSLSLEASGYLERLGLYAFRLGRYDDPANPGIVLNVGVTTPLDSAGIWGVNGALTWRPSTIANVRAVYGHTRSSGMAFQSIAALATLRTPATWALRDISATILVRAASGLAYLPLPNQGFGETTTGFVPFANTLPLTALPWTKSVDARLDRALHLGGVRGTVYADFRNLLNLRNVLGVFPETGGETNPLYEASVLSPELTLLHLEAQNNGRLLANSAVDLRPDCAGWTNGGGPVNCVVLRRVEQRFGDGDGVYDLGEQTTALNTYYQSFYGEWRFREPGRTARVGLALEF
ncbi:MAG TPA: hypothetical protein VLB49_06160 [Gemmatimonadales bacterium]|nr:hypothetical protein [Gemmatimonadales bacterium]